MSEVSYITGIPNPQPNLLLERNMAEFGAKALEVEELTLAKASISARIKKKIAAKYAKRIHQITNRLKQIPQEEASAWRKKDTSKLKILREERNDKTEELNSVEESIKQEERADPRIRKIKEENIKLNIISNALLGVTAWFHPELAGMVRNHTAEQDKASPDPESSASEFVTAQYGAGGMQRRTAA